MFQARQLCSIEDIKLRILKSIGFLEKSRMCGIFDETYTYDCLLAKYLNRSKLDALISKSKWFWKETPAPGFWLISFTMQENMTMSCVMKIKLRLLKQQPVGWKQWIIIHDLQYLCHPKDNWFWVETMKGNHFGVPYLFFGTNILDPYTPGSK